MYLYTRTGTAAPGQQMEATAFAVEIAAKVNSITSLDVRAWAPVYGAPLNMITWVAMVEHPADIAVTGEKLAADASYMDAVTGAAGLFSSMEDSMGQVVATFGPMEGDPHYAAVVSAQCTEGHIAAAMTWAVEMADHVHSVTGRDGSFVRSLYGPWAQVHWISLADTAQQVELGEAAMTADPTYLERIDQAADLFRTESATSMLSRRIG